MINCGSALAKQANVFASIVDCGTASPTIVGHSGSSSTNSANSRFFFSAFVLEIVTVPSSCSRNTPGAELACRNVFSRSGSGLGSSASDPPNRSGSPLTRSRTRARAIAPSRELCSCKTFRDTLVVDICVPCWASFCVASSSFSLCASSCACISENLVDEAFSSASPRAYQHWSRCTFMSFRSPLWEQPSAANSHGTLTN